MTTTDPFPADMHERLRVVGRPFDTTEIRWFAAGEPLQGYIDWFSGMGQDSFIELRNDAYHLGEDASVGLKRRDHGPLELKRRQGISPSLVLSGGFSGQLEEWRKTGLEEPLREIDWEWGIVDKVVLTRTFSIDAQGTVIEVPGRKPVTPACDIELATVAVDDTTSWTFALESWGPEETRRLLLTESLRVLLEGLPPMPEGFLTDLALNMGYPEWLAVRAWDGDFVAL